MTTKQKTENLVEEEREMDGEIERLEAERAELMSPARTLTWEEIQAGEDPGKRERRRGILPRLIVAAKVRRLELRRERYKREAEPLRRSREEAHERLEAAKAKRLAAIEEEGEVRAVYGDAHMRIQTREQRIKETEREIRALRGEG